MKQRLEMLLSMIPDVETVIDIGCDHGYLAQACAERENIRRVIATDISAPSLDKLQQRLPFLDAFIADKIRPVCCDGLQGLQQSECAGACLVLAGMGADLMRSILEQSLPLVQGEFQGD